MGRELKKQATKKNMTKIDYIVIGCLQSKIGWAILVLLLQLTLRFDGILAS